MLHNLVDYIESEQFGTSATHTARNILRIGKEGDFDQTYQEAS